VLLLSAMDRYSNLVGLGVKTSSHGWRGWRLKSAIFTLSRWEDGVPGGFAGFPGG
jgi:hypothetical protein